MSATRVHRGNAKDEAKRQALIAQWTQAKEDSERFIKNNPGHANVPIAERNLNLAIRNLEDLLGGAA